MQHNFTPNHGRPISAALGVAQFSRALIDLVEKVSDEARKGKLDRQSLAEIAEKATDLRLASSRLVNENEDLREALKHKGTLVFMRNAFWEMNENGLEVRQA